MSAPVKTAVEGIDKKIQALQLKLHTDLSSEWDTSLYDSYGRAYSVPLEKGGYKLELFNQIVDDETHHGSNEYSGDIYISDKKAALSFFYVRDEEYEDHQYESIVDIVFFVNLSLLKASITHRADEEVREDVLELLKTEPLGFRIKSLVVGIDNVFSGMDVSNIKYDNMQPYHVFKFVTIVKHR